MRELLDMVSSVVSRDVEESHTPDFATFTADVLDKRELLRTFIIQSEQNMADLQSAIKTGDIEKLHDIAHEIKPLVGVVTGRCSTGKTPHHVKRFCMRYEYRQ